MEYQKTNLIMSVLFVLLLSFGVVAQSTQEIYDNLNADLIAETSAEVALRADINSYVNSNGDYMEGPMFITRMREITINILAIENDATLNLNDIKDPVNPHPLEAGFNDILTRTGTELGNLWNTLDIVEGHMFDQVNPVIVNFEQQSTDNAAIVASLTTNGLSLSRAENMITAIVQAEAQIATIDNNLDTIIGSYALSDDTDAFTVFHALMDLFAPGRAREAQFADMQTRIATLTTDFANQRVALESYVQTQTQVQAANSQEDTLIIDLENRVNTELNRAQAVVNNVENVVIRSRNALGTEYVESLTSVDAARVLVSNAETSMQNAAQLEQERDTLLASATRAEFRERLSELDTQFAKINNDLQAVIDHVNALIQQELLAQQQQNIAQATTDLATLENNVQTLTAQVDDVVTRANQAVTDEDKAAVAGLRQEIASLETQVQSLQQEATRLSGEVSLLADLNTRVQAVANELTTMATSLNTADNNLAALVEPLQCEIDLADLEQKYEDFKDDFKDYEDDYEDAEDDNDEDDLEDAIDDLDDLRDDLEDLRDDVEDFEDDIDDDKYDDCDVDLDDDIDDLNDDIDDLIDEIDAIIGSKFSNSRDNSNSGSSSSSGRVSNTDTSSSTGTTSTSVKYLQDLLKQFASSDTETTNGTPSIEWEDTRYVAWLVAGIIIVAAFIIFLLGVMLMKK